MTENQVEWIVDTGATSHISANKYFFKEHKDSSDGNYVYIENSSNVLGKVTMKLTPRKNLALENVLYVIDVCRDIISGSLLNNVGVKLSLDFS